MISSHKRKVAAGAAALAVMAGGGAAIAATSGGSPQEESQAIIDDAAQQLGVTSSQLSDALKEALSNRVDAAVAAGELTEEQAAELKARIDSGDFPLVGVGPGHRVGHVHFGGLEAAESYLGLTEAELRTALEGGKSLADVAGDQGKSVDGLVAAMVSAAKEKLDQAVSAGRLTETQRDSMVADLQARIAALVNGERPAGPSVFQAPAGVRSVTGTAA